MHPTKREVHFLHEDEVVDDICEAVEAKLAGHGQSRVFEYQTLLTGGVASVGVKVGRRGTEKRKAPDEDGDEYMDDVEEIVPDSQGEFRY